MTKSKQIGASSFSILFMLIMGALAITLAIKVLPLYLDNNSVNSVITSLGEDSKFTSYTDDQVRQKIQSRVVINNIRDFDNKSIVIVRDNGKISVDANYEKRENIFKNIDVIVSFKNHFEAPMKGE